MLGLLTTTEIVGVLIAAFTRFKKLGVTLVIGPIVVKLLMAAVSIYDHVTRKES